MLRRQAARKTRGIRTQYGCSLHRLGFNVVACKIKTMLYLLGMPGIGLTMKRIPRPCTTVAARRDAES